MTQPILPTKLDPSLPRPILIIVHQEHSSPGLVGELLQAKGYELDIRRPCLGEPLPQTMQDHTAAIIFGGPMSANDDETLPFIRAELEWLPIAINSGKPFLGICLGAQLLARSLGATVSPHPTEMREIGYMPIYPATGETFLSGLAQVYHWHREGFELPQGARLLATGSLFPNQAFRYGETAYGVQFHPEITADLIERWTSAAADQLELPEAQSRETQLQKHAQFGNQMKQWLSQFLDQWLQSNWVQGDRPQVATSI
jgi:GMP synthase (glutamine-hydrolysing)